MYSHNQLAKKYLQYYLTASSGKGHGIHSPFVFDFIIHVLRDKKKYDCYDKIESVRKYLLKNNEEIEVQDFGAGSSVISSTRRKVKDIAASSLKSKRIAKLLFRIAKYYKCKTILELGTSFGVTTSYLASADPAAGVFTLEGSLSIASIAQKNFDELGLKNIHLIQGNFDDTLPALLQTTDKVDFAFVDGNHRKQPTLAYFNQLVSKSTPATIFVFDDIHWSTEMEESWKEIKDHSSVTLTIDLFFIGIVLFSNDFKEKQHFVIRF